MARDKKFLTTVQVYEDRYGNILNFPPALIKKLNGMAPDDSDAGKLSAFDHDALLYMVRRGDFTRRAMAENLHHSQQWVRNHLPEIEAELRGRNHA
ncbi:hypothetical protein [Furfurilactobacillus milii]|uniref:Uncharacterized protein n=1 Tax=Furfurilactobacillus milii TaxID=2888272 RepID=A0ABT6DCU1_9LACO|nr:hypothetical protein [Furfurilactobacillus milii]QLE67440.1 hypothetical protein LROSL2_2122 [Furfurilactobacillus rossiae]MCF6161881.1 hypothetical protein [Furfurilactobacillus milii]MCF6164261.1 hypothetical protein [Furfurilactobacillus milii]MDF9914886.1 hypothetical protein [Furfurilactobacillus milii]QLE69869.1 hypothetical protein LROSL3_2148 [Furfurilactobacillus rossiae]